MRCNNRNLKIVRLISLLIVAICLVIVIASVFVKKNVTSNNLANKKMEELARDYYENDFYKRFIRDHVTDEQEKDLTKYFERYTVVGFTPVKLRRLLDYSEKNNKDMQKYFSHEKFNCDTNSSYAIIKPKAPFSAKDYDLTVSLSCKES